MPNQNYLKGVRKERAVVNEHRARGEIAFRSAGSHSPIDVCCIDTEHHEIKLFQCKPDDYSQKAKKALEDALKGLNGPYVVRFEVI